MVKRRLKLKLLTSLALVFASVVFSLQLVKVTTIRQLYKTSLDKFGDHRFNIPEVAVISPANLTATAEIVVVSDVPAPNMKQLNPFEARFARRRDLAERVCKKYDPDYKQTQINNTRNGILMERTIVDLKKRALMCYTLKAGSSSWNDVFWHFREPEIAAKQKFFKRAFFGNQNYYRELSDKQRSEVYTDPETVTMMSIRHPFARLISAWEDKFTKRYYYNHLFKEYPLMKNFPNLYGRWNGRGHFMSWESFMQYVANHGSTLSNLDPHFRPSTCDPCTFPFKLIVKAETFDSSRTWLLKEKLHVDNMHQLNRGRASSRPEETIRDMFSKLNRETISKVMSIFSKEMEMFDYTFDLDTLTAGGWDELSD